MYRQTMVRELIMMSSGEWGWGFPLRLTILSSGAESLTTEDSYAYYHARVVCFPAGFMALVFFGFATGIIVMVRRAGGKRSRSVSVVRIFVNYLQVGWGEAVCGFCKLRAFNIVARL